jgi:2-amino-4-hydroxy-6-hydroxymethyldihydropteridine diphosphokinase
MKLLVSLGSNIGDKQQNIERAIALIDEKIGSVVKKSSFYTTEPVGFTSDNNFINAAIEVKTNLPIYRILKITQKIERLMGRTQKSSKGVYHDRVIDIDILIYGNKKIHSARLTVPHPRMYERDFVMQPLREITNIK